MVMKNGKDKTLKIYSWIVVGFVAFALVIIGKMSYTMFVKDDFWMELFLSKQVGSDKDLDSSRGNIYDTNGKLLAGTLPEYMLFVDMRAGGFNDSTFRANIQEISEGLARVLPSKSKEYYRDLLKNALKRKYKKGAKRNVRVYPDFVSYIQRKELMKIPYIAMGTNKSGFHFDEVYSRKRPFGDLAASFIGDLHKEKEGGAKNGLEFAYDSILRGTKGVMFKQKVLNKFTEITKVEAIDGMDVVTTLDVEIQDIVEDALKNKLIELGRTSSYPHFGVAIVMEVKTGDVKAMVNLGCVRDSIYRETEPFALSHLMEPGSTFKAASILVGLDDGYLSMNDEVDTGNGMKMMHRRMMRDHNAGRGYGVIDLQHILMYSSNIGVSELIDQHYHSNPQKYIDGLKRVGIFENWDIPLAAYLPPRYIYPDSKGWNATSLPWMSIGYNSQLAPINTVTFYNAIANNGKLMAPRFVKAIMQDGEVIEEFPPVVAREKIASQHALDTLKFILEKVVSEGLGKKAGNDVFPVAGKTGTALVYDTDLRKYGSDRFVSFAGYFPADNPMYTCIVCINKKAPASGGSMSGDVFGRIAEKLYARQLRPNINEIVDTVNVFSPIILKGNITDASVVLSDLGIAGNYSCFLPDVSNKQSWGVTTSDSNGLSFELADYKGSTVPDVVGMGAKDAVYLMEKAGLKVKISGIGIVKSQSIPAGNKIPKNGVVKLYLGYM